MLLGNDKLACDVLAFGLDRESLHALAATCLADWAGNHCHWLILRFREQMNDSVFPSQEGREMGKCLPVLDYRPAGVSKRMALVTHISHVTENE